MAPETLDERELVAWRAFFEMQERLRGRIEQQLQADSGLSNADYTVLVVLSEAEQGRMRLVELGQLLGWEKSRLHHQLSRMCGRGLVRRQHGEGRAIHAAITPAGRAALEAAVPLHAGEVRRLVFERLTTEQVDQLAAISRAILEGLQQP